MTIEFIPDGGLNWFGQCRSTKEKIDPTKRFEMIMFWSSSVYLYYFEIEKGLVKRYCSPFRQSFDKQHNRSSCRTSGLDQYVLYQVVEYNCVITYPHGEVMCFSTFYIFPKPPDI